MKQIIRSRLLGAVALAMMASPVLSAPRDVIYQPKAGSAQRRAIFDALRVPIAKKVGKKVIFQGSLNASKSGWAFFSGAALLDNGGNGRVIDQDDPTGGEMVALLRLSGGKWRVLSWGFGGGTDAMDEAMKKYPKAPRALFRFSD